MVMDRQNDRTEHGKKHLKQEKKMAVQAFDFKV